MSILEVNNELAHDLVHEHLDTLLALIDRPLTEADVVARLGSKRVLERMLRHGLVEARDGQVKAVASVYHQLRQEGMMAFLEHYILPALTAGHGFSTLATAYLSLRDDAILAMRPERTARLFDTLNAVSDAPCNGVPHKLTVMVIGTTRVSREPLDAETQALVHVKQAALQRATPDEKPLAMLSQFVFMADASRHQAASEAVAAFLASLDSEHASSPALANYHLSVATHWQTALPTPCDVEGQ